jgi:pimeloyl-ACP methyl ester carboxylesterase
MAPRLLLVPQFTELEWGIRPHLEEWAEVATFDLPGVGEEPIFDSEIASVASGASSVGDLALRRAMEEVDRLGWDRYFVAADGYGTAPAATIAATQPEAVKGLALGHACLSYAMQGERPVIVREVWAAMRQLLRQDHDQFLRYGIVQMTRGSVDDATAREMVDRFPKQEFMEAVWDSLETENTPIGELLKDYGGPLLLAEHVGCLSFTEEGFADAVEAFPDAHVVRVPQAPGADAQFAAALREFCGEVEAREGGRVSRPPR